MLRLLGKLLASAPWLLAAAPMPSQQPVAPPVPHRYIVVYNPSAVDIASVTAHVTGLSILRQHNLFGVAILQLDPAQEDAAVSALRADPAVEYLVHDRVLSAHSLILRAPVAATVGVTVGAPPTPISTPTPTPKPAPTPAPTPAPSPYDTYYTSTPQGWAVVQSGGYGAAVAGGPVYGPWDTTLGNGVRIAVLDSGVDQNHPDLAPNLAFNLSDIDQSPATGLPSACDDGSPQDQQGHGSWTASLAAGAMGTGTGLIVGVAPTAAILNIKVLERLPDPASTATDIATQCETGQASGLLSWVIQGIQDAIAQHAQVISLSLGTLVDLETGEGAGLQAAFDRVTYAATQAGAVVVASAGNDGLSLANPRYIELPAQARGVLAVVASTNPACAENLAPGATCAAGPVTLPYYSNFGAPLNAIAAPGGSYPDGTDTGVSGWVRGACSSGLANTSDGPPADSAHSFGCFNLGHIGYVQAMGTSASAALAAGAAALVIAANPTWTPEQVVAGLRNAAIPTASLPSAPVLNPAPLLP
jgi:subtilisin family serine protease